MLRSIVIFVTRGVLVALAGLLAAVAAWLVVRDQPEVHERTVTFVLLPGTNLSDAQIPDAVRGLSQQDAQLVNTIGGAIGSDRFLQDALGRADVAGPADYGARSSRRPGSDIIELHLSGPDPEALAAVAEEYNMLATRWVGSVYRAYRLEFLEEEPSAGPVAPRVTETVGLGLLLGLFVGAGAVFVEWKARQRRRARIEPVPAADGPPLRPDRGVRAAAPGRSPVRTFHDPGAAPGAGGVERRAVVRRPSDAGGEPPRQQP